jgi:dolichol-phosphate mannosyltransferase
LVAVTLSLVVPCFQEEEALPPLLDLLRGVPADEILLVDDGSTDGTPAVLARLAAEDPRVRVFRHASNRGVGAAMRTGIAAAAGDVIVVYDADATYPPADIARLAEGVREGADLVTAVPIRADDTPWFRRVLTAGAARAYRSALGGGDGAPSCFTCAFRAYRAAWAKALPFESDGFPAAAEILGRAVLSGARIREVESRLAPRRHGRSKMRIVRALLAHRKVLGELRRLRRMTGQ